MSTAGAAYGAASGAGAGTPCNETALHDALRALHDALAEIAYNQLYTLLAGAQLLAPTSGAALRAARAVGGGDGAALELLGAGAAVGVGRLPAALARAVPLLARAGLLGLGSGGARATGWLVVPALGGYLLTGLPPTYASAARVGASAYLGPDSLRLAAALPDARNRRVLDIGTGCGIQGLLAARGASEAVCTDTELRSLELAGYNQVLNGTDHPVRLLAGDLYAPVGDERFDLVVSLPPYVPEVPDAAVSATVGGGKDGLGILRPLLAGAAAHLLPGGELVTRCQLLCDGTSPLIARELDVLCAGLDVTVTCSDWHPLQPYVLELATSFATYGARASVRELVGSYTASLRGLGATGVCTALIRCRRAGPAPAGERREPRVRLVGWTPPPDRTTVARPGPDLVLADGPATRAAAKGWATTTLDGPDAALLRAVDGTRSVAEAVGVAWGAPPGASTDDLVDQALGRLGRLAAAGLVELAATPPPTPPPTTTPTPTASRA